MEPYQYFIAPIMDDKAQVAIIALMALALLDVLFGVVNAWFVQQQRARASHEWQDVHLHLHQVDVSPTTTE